MVSLAALPAPDFLKVVEDVHNLEPIHAILPSRYTRPAIPPSPVPANPGQGSHTGAGQQAPSMPGTALDSRCTRVNNTTPDTFFNHFKSMNLQLASVWNKAREAGHPVPSNG